MSMMKFRKLGNTDLTVSEISLGCSGFWGNARFPERQAADIIHTAFDAGVNFFDTGHNYCHFHAEPRLGRILKPLFAQHDRSQFVLSTKAGTIVPSAPLVFRNRPSKDFSPDYIEATCAKSIQNLNCEYLDIFQLHGITQDQITPALIDRLSSMKERGMFRCLGVNSHSAADLLYIADHPELFDMVLLDFNVLQLDREPVIRKLAEVGIGVVAGTVLAQGHLVAGKIGSFKSTADLWYLARALLKSTGRQFSRNAQPMREALATVENLTPAQAAFAYVLANQDISSCVFGTTKIKNLSEILAASEQSLSADVRAAIRSTFEQIPERISA
ncbi:aldo/keto reductase [Gimesia benthica]|uniref:Aldo/keto reductase n=2 Tax=Gimesia benthica TaxID=2608982 RepID=A0A6I6AIZ0_9PLAN|nr:aldo/keto reductase [Gimesia benthica]